MILAYNALENSLKKTAQEFLVNTNSDINRRSWDQQESYLMGPVFGNGDHLFFFVYEDQIKGCIGIIYAEATVKGIVYLTEVRATNKTVLEQLVYFVLEQCRINECEDIYLGIRSANDYLSDWLNEELFIHSHNMVQLLNDNCKIYSDEGTLSALKREDASEFASIMSDAFMDVPNGATLTTEEVLGMLDDSSDLGFLEMDGSIVGVYELSIKQGVGWIDNIGIRRSEQGKGYGKLLFRALIDKLLIDGACTLRMLVADKNRRAYSMYIDHGFREEKIFSSWYLYKK